MLTEAYLCADKYSIKSPYNRFPLTFAIQRKSQKIYTLMMFFQAMAFHSFVGFYFSWFLAPSIALLVIDVYWFWNIVYEMTFSLIETCSDSLSSDLGYIMNSSPRLRYKSFSPSSKQLNLRPSLYQNEQRFLLYRSGFKFLIELFLALEWLMNENMGYPQWNK